MGYVHRDIKPMNILLMKVTDLTSSLNDSGAIFQSDEQLVLNSKLIVKLADFGLATTYNENEDTMIHTICGSPYYMAPEIFINKKYNSKADIWSFGVVMYQLLFGINPHAGPDMSIVQLIDNLKFKNIDFQFHKNFTPHCYDLLTKLLAKDVDDRMDWVNLFNHQWFTYWKNPDAKEDIKNDYVPNKTLGFSNLSKMKLSSNYFNTIHPSSSYPPDKKYPLNWKNSSYGNASKESIKVPNTNSEIFDMSKYVFN